MIAPDSKISFVPGGDDSPWCFGAGRALPESGCCVSRCSVSYNMADIFSAARYGQAVEYGYDTTTTSSTSTTYSTLHVPSTTVERVITTVIDTTYTNNQDVYVTTTKAGSTVWTTVVITLTGQIPATGQAPANGQATATGQTTATGQPDAASAPGM